MHPRELKYILLGSETSERNVVWQVVFSGETLFRAIGFLV
jgi:hypothetical protein